MEILASLVANYPFVMSVVAIVGALRLVIKPIMALLHAVAAQTPTKADDEALAKLTQSKLYAGFLFVLDWLASIKKPA